MKIIGTKGEIETFISTLPKTVEYFENTDGFDCKNGLIAPYNGIKIYFEIEQVEGKSEV